MHNNGKKEDIVGPMGALVFQYEGFGPTNLVHLGENTNEMIYWDEINQ